MKNKKKHLLLFVMIGLAVTLKTEVENATLCIPMVPTKLESSVATNYTPEVIACIREERYLVEASPYISENDMELIALVTMAEAEDEPEEGKRLVIDTILNRLYSVNFPSSVEEVIYQKNQFSSMWNGRINWVRVDDYIMQLVREELCCQKSTDVIYFTADKYGKYGTPMFSVGNHYFSSD